MSTLATMVAEIREEIRRTNIDPAIKRSICAAVLFHRDKRFKWNELSFDFATVADQQIYTVTDDAYIGRIASFDSVKIVSPETVLDPRDILFIRGRVEQASGTPQNYAYYEASIYLDPVPASILSVSVLGTLELLDPNQNAANQIMTRDNILTLPDNYSTDWFGDGYEVIKPYAKGYLNLHHLRNEEESGNQFNFATAMKDDQVEQLGRIGGSGFARPTKF